jgi:hypothetical protein
MLFGVNAPPPQKPLRSAQSVGSKDLDKVGTGEPRHRLGGLLNDGIYIC